MDSPVHAPIDPGFDWPKGRIGGGLHHLVVIWFHMVRWPLLDARLPRLESGGRGSLITRIGTWKRPLSRYRAIGAIVLFVIEVEDVADTPTREPMGCRMRMGGEIPREKDKR